MNLKAVCGVVLVFALLPFAAASNQVQSTDGDVTGRALLFDLTRFDPDLAAVAGHASAKVSWFGGALTFEKGNEGWVYASTSGAADPTKQRLVPTGVWYNFTDDNGATWNVQEWYALQVREVQYRLGDQQAVERQGHKAYVWTVATSGKVWKDADLGLAYSFVVIVDTAKLGVHPVDGEGRPTGPAYDPDGGDHQIDLHFTTADPARHCRAC